MNKVRLFNDVPGETYTEKGSELSKGIGGVSLETEETSTRPLG